MSMAGILVLYLYRKILSIGEVQSGVRSDHGRTV